MLVILPTQEAEIRTEVQGQFWQKVIEICPALVAHACNPSYSEGSDQEDCGSKPAKASSSRDPILKKPSTKRTGGVAQLVERLCKCEALNSNPSTEREKNPSVLRKQKTPNKHQYSFGGLKYQSTKGKR
jgi:hypothetical protein